MNDNCLFSQGKASRWDINMDISAPKIIMPENFEDTNPQLVIVDLGNFHCNTISVGRKQERRRKDTDGGEGWGKQNVIHFYFISQIFL